ncbi:hypothetical protein NMG60_11028323 [Bertholletia excelsa]
MASNSARKLIQRSSASARAFLGRSTKAQSAPSAGCGLFSFPGLAPSNSSPASRLSRHRLFFSPRHPVELGCGDSLMPLHSATASVLLNSLLSSEVGQWGCLSEGFATPL